MANADFYSIVEYFNERDACHCGYCGDDNSSYSHGEYFYVKCYMKLIICQCYKELSFFPM